MLCGVTHSFCRVSLLWKILYLPWLIPWLLGITPLLLCTCNMVLFSKLGPSIWCTTFKWQDERNGAMIVTEGQKLYFEMKGFTTGCDCGVYKKCNRLLDTVCQYRYRSECQNCILCEPFKEKKIVFLARNTGKIKTLEVDGITSQSIEPIEVASCKVGPVSSTGVYKGYCWYSNSQASLQPFYTYILTNGGPLMESFVWTTLMAGSVSVSLTTADWISNNTIRVGERAILKVTQKDAYGNPVSSNTVLEVDCFEFSAYVASDFRASVAVSSENVKYDCDRTNNGNGYVSWYPTRVGKFWLQIGNGATNIRGSPFPVNVVSGPLSIKSCTALWPGSVNTFVAGNVATLKIFQKDSSGNAYSSMPFNFLVKVTTRASGVNVPLKFSVSVEANGVQKFSFNLTLVGEFNIYVGNALGEQISGSPFFFKVIPGAIDIASCTGTWQFFNDFSAGDVAKFLVTQRDSNGNIVSLQNGRSDAINLDAKFSRLNNESVPLKAAAAVDFVTGIQTIQFASTLSGSFNLQIGKGAAVIRNSPFFFRVFPGPIYTPACKGRWIQNVNEFNAGMTASLNVIVTDKYGNEFNTSFPFIVSVQTRFGMKVQNMPINVSPGSENDYMLIQLVTKEAGNYYLNVGSTKESISNAPIPFSVRAAALSLPDCLAEWENSFNISIAGNMLALRILQMDAFGNNISHSTGVFDQTANYITKVIDALRSEEIRVKTTQEENLAAGYHYIKLVPETTGQYLLFVGDGKRTLRSSPFPFTVIPGALSLSNTYAFWEMNTNILKAGIVASLGIWSKDSYDNTIDARNTSIEFVFKVLHMDALTMGSRINLNISIVPEKTKGYWSITMRPSLIGKFLLEVATTNGNISNSPISFTVIPGPFSLQHSTGQWEDDMNDFQPPGIARFYLTLKDLGGNILKESVSSSYNITIQVYEAPNFLLSVPNMQMNYTKSALGNFEVLFSMDHVGKYLLAISQGVNHLPGSPFPFHYIAGAVDPSKTTLHGKGLNNSIAGDISVFEVQLRDKSGYPTDSSNTSITVSILRFGDQLELPKNITLVPDMKGLFNVSFVAKVAGQYVLRIRWRGVPLHSVPAIYKSVFPGPIYLANTKVIGSGIERGVAGRYLEFTISFYDALNNSNPEGKANVSITFTPSMLTSHETTTKNSSVTMKYRITKALLNPYNLTILARIFNVTYPIPGSPFQVYIESGAVSTINSLGGWKDDRNTFEVNGMAEFIITPRDIFGNEIVRSNSHSCSCNFSAQIFTKQSSAPIPVRDMLIVAMTNSSIEKQKLTFSLQKPGEYWLQVGNVLVNILGSPFSFSYVTGLPNKNKSSFTGNGLNDSYIGDVSSFIIKARDRAGNPIVSDLNLLNVTIVTKSSLALVVNASLVEGYPGTFVVAYRTYVAGQYTVLVRLMSVLLYQGKKYVYAGPISLRKCKAFGSGLQGGDAGEALSFHIIPYDDYNNVNFKDNFSISLVFTPNITSFSQVSQNQSGIFLISYKTTIAQIYSLTIIAQTAVTELPIPGSPFEITIIPGKVNFSRSQVTGFGLSSLAAVGSLNTLLVYLFDSYGNPSSITENLLHVSISPRSNASVAKFVCLDAGQCETSYKVLQHGTYNISVKYNDTHFGGSPFKQLVNNDSGALKPDDCIAEVQKPVVAAGERESTIVHCHDIHGDYFKSPVKLKFTLDLRPRVSERPLNYSFVDHLNGTYTTMFTVYVSGSYTLIIRLFGSPIKNNPYQFSVIPGPIDVPSCVAYGNGLFRGIADSPQNVTVQARDRFQNLAINDADVNGNHTIFYMRISGKNVDTTVPLVWVSNGYYKGVYALSQTGFYMLSIQSQGKHIYGSPFHATIGADLYNVPKITSHPYLILTFEGIPYMFGSSLQQIQLTYSKPLSIVTMELKAQHGYLYPSEKMSQNWEDIKAINPRFDGSNYTLTFSGLANSINKALRAFMYQGNSYYNGDDTLFCSVMDQKGSIDTRLVNITIKAVNNPPYIVTAHEYFYVDSSEVSQRLVEMHLNNISVGDFDQFDKPDEDEILQMDVTLEVELGTLTLTLTSLPAMTAASRQGQNEWKHLDKIVELNTSVQMMGQGIKFQASIDDTNAALETLYYSIGPLEESNFIDTLVITANDQGNYGCYGSCSNDIKVPLFATAKIIIRTYPKEDNKLSVAKISMITTFTIVASFMGVASGWIWYKWSKKVHIKVEELVESEMKKQMFYDPLWIPEDE